MLFILAACELNLNALKARSHMKSCNRLKFHVMQRKMVRQCENSKGEEQRRGGGGKR